MKKYKFYTVPMDPGMYHQIRILAAKADMSMAALGRRLLIREIAKAEKEAKRK